MRQGSPYRWALPVAMLSLTLAFDARAAGNAEAGASLYGKHCSQCHGQDGNADGPAALFMLPRPRVFKDNASYKFRTTAAGELPTDEDLYRVITVGIPGSAMPGFPSITEQSRWDLVEYIKSLAEDFTDEDMLEAAVMMPELAGEQAAPELTEERLANGKKLYESNQCGKCHGNLGRGNGPSYNELKDDWKNPILPANLANPETLRNGDTVDDVYRTISTGLNGSPMPSYADSIPAEQRWDLAYYVLSMGPGSNEKRADVIKAFRLEELPKDDGDEAWAAAPIARLKTAANVIEPPRLYWPSVEYVRAQAFYTDTEVALRIQWDDRSQSKGNNTTKVYRDGDGKIYANTDHPDQFGIQFPARQKDPSKRPYFLYGDGKRAVNLWWWRSDTGTLAERNAKGFTNMRDQPERSQTLMGRVSYADGRYTMVVRRTLTTDDLKRDVQFEAGSFAPISFHALDGNRGEVGLRGAMTTWYWLYLKPQISERTKQVPYFAFALSLIVLLLIGRTVKRSVGNDDDAA